MAKQHAKTVRTSVTLNPKLKKRLDEASVPVSRVVERALVQYFGLDPDTLEAPGADVEMVNQIMDAKAKPASEPASEPAPEPERPDEDEDVWDMAMARAAEAPPKPGTYEHLFHRDSETDLYQNLPEPYDGVPWENTYESGMQTMSKLGNFYREVESGRVVVYHPAVNKVVYHDDFARIMRDADPEVQQEIVARIGIMVMTGHGVVYEFRGYGFETLLEADGTAEERSLQTVPADGPQPEPIKRKTGPAPAGAMNQVLL